MKKLEEFWYCVSPQDNLPIFVGKDNEIKDELKLVSFIENYKEKNPNISTRDFLTNILLENPEMIKEIRVLLGISDKRLYLDLTYIFNYKGIFVGDNRFDESRYNLIKHNTSFFINQLKNNINKKIYAEVISEYFYDKGINNVLNTFSKLGNDEIKVLYENLISPKEVQQRQAKLRGHGAEMEFAKIFNYFGLTVLPINKHIDPMKEKDPNVNLSTMKILENNKSKDEDTYSFDLVIKDSNNNIRILVQSLIHSSDPGQYGVNKSDETIIIKNKINDYNEDKSDKDKIYLVGCVDGVGFSENPNGTIVRLLDSFDYFFQINTLFKIPILLMEIGLINNLEGISLDTDFFEEEFINEFSKKYFEPLKINDLTNGNTEELNFLNAGKGVIYLSS